MTEDYLYMERALKLAALGRGKTSPNPMVGAVVVLNGRVVGEGYHQKAGTPHAEVHALRQAGDKAKGAVLYVTLEPCCHYGRTPPCTEAIIRSGVRRVVVAVEDPNPLVSGKGIQALREAGIEVEVGVLEAEARRLNEAFFKYMLEKRPFVTIKAAMSLDGKIATATGDSKWITGTEAREFVQRLRAESDAIMVGIGTVLADDPLLTVRLAGEEKKPLRVIVDSNLRIPVESQIVSTAHDVPTVVATVEGKCDVKKKKVLEDAGVEVWQLPGDNGRVRLRSLLEELAKKEVLSVLLEGGATLNAAALAAGVVDKLVFFYAPKIIGGSDAPGPFGGKGVDEIKRAIMVEELRWEKIGEDLMVIGYPAKQAYRE